MNHFRVNSVYYTGAIYTMYFAGKNVEDVLDKFEKSPQAKFLIPINAELFVGNKKQWMVAWEAE
jgi:hypothetical protein